MHTDICVYVWVYVSISAWLFLKGKIWVSQITNMTVENQIFFFFFSTQQVILNYRIQCHFCMVWGQFCDFFSYSVAQWCNGSILSYALSLALFQTTPYALSLPTSTPLACSHGGSAKLSAIPNQTAGNGSGLSNPPTASLRRCWLTDHMQPVLCSSWNTPLTNVSSVRLPVHFLLNYSSKR